MDKVFLDFRSSPVVHITEVRSTMIVLGLQGLRSRGLIDRYSDLLTPELREKIFSLVAGVWVPVELVLEHYRASSRLNIDDYTLGVLCREVAERAYKHIFAPIIVQARKMTVWESFALAHKNNDINHRGGDVRITQEGPRQVLHEWAGQPCASIPYFARSHGTVMHAILELFCSRVAHCLVPDRSSPTIVATRLAWTDNESQGIPVAHPLIRDSGSRKIGK